MDLVPLITQLASGVGGDIAGRLLEKTALGPVGNSITDAPTRRSEGRSWSYNRAPGA